MATKKKAAKKKATPKPEEPKAAAPPEEPTPPEPQAPPETSGPRFAVPENEPGHHIGRIEIMQDRSRGRMTALFTYRDSTQDVPGNFVCDNYGFVCLELSKILYEEAKRTGVIT